VFPARDLWLMVGWIPGQVTDFKIRFVSEWVTCPELSRISSPDLRLVNESCRGKCDGLDFQRITRLRWHDVSVHNFAGLNSGGSRARQEMSWREWKVATLNEIEWCSPGMDHIDVVSGVA
jgi:hypothetical protein